MARSFKRVAVYKECSSKARGYYKRQAIICGFRRDKSYLDDEDYVPVFDKHRAMASTWGLAKWHVRYTTRRSFKESKMVWAVHYWNTRRFYRYAIDLPLEEYLKQEEKLADENVRRVWNK